MDGCERKIGRSEVRTIKKVKEELQFSSLPDGPPLQEL